MYAECSRSLLESSLSGRAELKDSCVRRRRTGRWSSRGDKFGRHMVLYFFSLFWDLIVANACIGWWPAIGSSRTASCTTKGAVAMTC